MIGVSYLLQTFWQARGPAREDQHAGLVDALLFLHLVQGAVGHAPAPFDDVREGNDVTVLVGLLGHFHT